LQFSLSRTRFLAVGLVLAVILAACDAGTRGTNGGNASIGFASPSEGDTVSVPFQVELESNVALAEPETGNMHAHLYFDTSTDATDYDIVYGTVWQVTRQLAPGEHTIIAALANPDHSLAGPTQEITVTVGEEGQAGADGADAGAGSSTPPSQGIFDY
jgi:hypothetical protein